MRLGFVPWCSTGPHYVNCIEEHVSRKIQVQVTKEALWPSSYVERVKCDIANSGTTFLAKARGTTSKPLTFDGKWRCTRSRVVAFNDWMHFFLCGSCFAIFITRCASQITHLVQGWASSSKGGGRSVGDATLEGEGEIVNYCRNTKPLQEQDCSRRTRTWSNTIV